MGRKDFVTKENLSDHVADALLSKVKMVSAICGWGGGGGARTTHSGFHRAYARARDFLSFSSVNVDVRWLFCHVSECGALFVFLLLMR